MFRAIRDSVVLYPLMRCPPSAWWRPPWNTRASSISAPPDGHPIIYGPEEEFPLGGCKVLRQSDSDMATVIGAGVTLYEALAAYEALQKEGIAIRVIDLYSVKPVDVATLHRPPPRPPGHHHRGGPLSRRRHRRSGHGCPGPQPGQGLCLAVTKKPKTGKPAELLDLEDISRSAIVKLVKQIEQGMLAERWLRSGRLGTTRKDIHGHLSLLAKAFSAMTQAQNPP